MNQLEEHVSDALAFRLLEVGSFGFDFVARGVLARRGGVEHEYDLIGVRVGDDSSDPWLENIETKLGTDREGRRGARQRRSLRDQLERARGSGFFNRVWGAWDATDSEMGDRLPGCGTLILHRSGRGVVDVERRVTAEPLLRSGSPDVAPVVRAIRQLVDHWRRINVGRVVYLCCHHCSGEVREMHAFKSDVWNTSAEATPTQAGVHAWFCPQNPARVRRYETLRNTWQFMMNGEWRGSSSTSAFLPRR